MNVPLSKPYVSQEMKTRVLEVIDSGQYILGKNCKEFEKEFAQYIGTKHSVLTSSGTSALFLCHEPGSSLRERRDRIVWRYQEWHPCPQGDHRDGQE